jgi:MazG family protein
MHLKEFDRLIQIMKRLRKECPWDREQTPASLRQYILEEAYETIEAIDGENWGELKKELGDLLLQIVFQAEIAEEEKRFTLPEVIEHINNKLIERHPHVFGEVSVRDAQDVKNNWEQIKVKSEKRKSILEGVPRNLSALLRAQRLQDKASHTGFDWENSRQVIEKIREEIEELQQTASPEETEEELGDLLFSLVNLSRFYKINAEDALRKTIHKFISRFQYIERKIAQQGLDINKVTLEEMDRLWEEAKSLDKPATNVIKKAPSTNGNLSTEKLEQFTSGIINFSELAQLWPFVAEFCQQYFGIENVAVITSQYDISPYQLDYLKGFSEENIKPLLTSQHFALLETLETERKILHKHDLNPDNTIFKIMDRLQISVAIPIVKQQELMAIMFLGNNRNDNRMPQPQLQYLKLMGSQIAFAMANIRSIQETVQSQKMAGLGMFASQLAHDFRSFISITKTLNRENERLARHAAYMEKMVQDLLNYARQQELKLTGVNINDLLEMTLDIIQTPPSLKIEKHYTPDLPKLSLDIHQMRRVFTNLFENSIRAMRTNPSGRIKITTKELRPLSRFRRNPWIYIEILDEGIGIPEEYLERIFDPFFTTRKNEGGNGLGLAIVKQVIARHSGFIDVASKTGKGTIFSIRLPHRNIKS